VHNVGVELALWTAGIALISGEQRAARRGWHHLFNAPVVAICTAIILHFIGARQWLPGVALNAVHNVGITAIPLGLLLTGATFADEFKSRVLTEHTGISIAAIVLRLGILPALMLLLARWLPAPIELRSIIVIQAAMPCAVMPVILAKHYGADSATAMRIVLATSVFALLTIPLWLQLGFQWALRSF
jgi:predicted permease